MAAPHVRLVTATLFVFSAACGGSSTPTAPAATTTGITISGNTDLLRVQENVTFAAVASRSDGSTQAVTEWASDAPTVLSINATTGVATGLAAGQATITARNGGVAATRLLRVVPHYQGAWTGRYLVAGCTASGDYLTFGWCGSLQGQNLPFSLTLSQTRDTVSGTITFGEYTGSVSGSAAMNGALTLAGTAVSGGASISISSWSTNSASFGVMTGNFSQRVTSTTLSGSAIHTSQILSATRGANSEMSFGVSAPSRGPDTIETMLRRMFDR